MERVAELAWAAGLVEGEGSFHVQRRGGVSLSVTMTDEDVLHRLAEVLRLGSVTGPYTQRRGTKPQWRWTLSCARHCAAVAQTLYPLLGSRRQAQARRMLEEWRRMPGRKGRVYC